MFDHKQQYRNFKEGTLVAGAYAVSLWYDCTAATIPVHMEAEQLEPQHRDYLVSQGRAYAQAQAQGTAPVTS